MTEANETEQQSISDSVKRRVAMWEQADERMASRSYESLLGPWKWFASDGKPLPANPAEAE